MNSYDVFLTNFPLIFYILKLNKQMIKYSFNLQLIEQTNDYVFTSKLSRESFIAQNNDTLSQELFQPKSN